jgi:hypothetical protein
VTTAVNIVATDLGAPTNAATLTGFDPTHRVRFSKPRAAASGGLLSWDAYSLVATDSDPPSGGLTWINNVSIYGNNGGADVLLLNVPRTPQYATVDEAYATLASRLPFTVSGYATYKVIGVNDTPLGDNRGGLSIRVDDLGPAPPTSWTSPDPDVLAEAKRVGVLLRVATSPVIRLWSGQVRDLSIPAGGAEPDDGAIYQSMGLLTGLPALGAALNGDAERLEFTVSGAAVTGEVAALAGDGASDVRGRAVDVGLVLFDDAWQIVPPIYWLWSGTADSLTVERTGDAQAPTRTLKLSAGNVFTGRRRPNLTFFTDIDQRRRSSDDAFFDQVAKYQAGTTKVWGYV